MGAEHDDGIAGDGEGPIRRVRLAAYTIALHAVTVQDFEEFTSATGYTTDAERYGWSFVFHLFVRRASAYWRPEQAPWWCAVPGAYWRAPTGPGAEINVEPGHPAVHISYYDAVAYCRWSGTRLPTEAEWERAARGDGRQTRFPWGEELVEDGRHRANVWQGTFPDVNTGEDGYIGTAPVDAYEPNEWGLYNTIGNVWEWCSDWFSTRHPKRGAIIDPVGPPRGEAKVMKGGSYLCHAAYCNRYRLGARTASTAESSSGNVGFRVAGDAVGTMADAGPAADVGVGVLGTYEAR